MIQEFFQGQRYYRMERVLLEGHYAHVGTIFALAGTALRSVSSRANADQHPNYSPDGLWRLPRGLRNR